MDMKDVSQLHTQLQRYDQMTRSGLQRQVLTLYKEFLLVVKQKPEVTITYNA